MWSRSIHCLYGLHLGEGLGYMGFRVYRRPIQSAYSCASDKGDMAANKLHLRYIVLLKYRVSQRIGA